MGKCPNCGKLSVKVHRPFCSKHCANIDLARWFDGSYRIPTDEAPMVYESNPNTTNENKN